MYDEIFLKSGDFCPKTLQFCSIKSPPSTKNYSWNVLSLWEAKNHCHQHSVHSNQSQTFCCENATWAFTGPHSQQYNSRKSRLLTSFKAFLVMLQNYRLIVMSWNDVMPPPRLAWATFMNACGVTDVVCHQGPCCRECVSFVHDFMYLCIIFHCVNTEERFVMAFYQS